MQNPSVLMAWLGAVAYTFQLYFDFSGYSDMAIGLGKMFGFHFSENFNYPHISKSFTEFWRRFHISLNTWFRDDVYIEQTKPDIVMVASTCGQEGSVVKDGIWDFE